MPPGCQVLKNSISFAFVFLFLCFIFLVFVFLVYSELSHVGVTQFGRSHAIFTMYMCM